MALSISNLKDSLDRVLFERMSSPLFGTYIFAWCAWNWKIIYVTLFVDEQQVLYKNKLDFIALELMHPHFLYWYPIFTTIGVLLIFPVLSNFSYWLMLQFTKWKRTIKHKFEETTPLTKEESNEIRKEYRGKRAELKSYIHDIEISNGSLLEENQLTKTENVKLKKRIGELERKEIEQQGTLEEYELDIKDLSDKVNQHVDQTEKIERLTSTTKRLTFLISESQKPHFQGHMALYNNYPIRDSLTSIDVPSLLHRAKLTSDFVPKMGNLVKDGFAFFDPSRNTYYLTEKGKELWFGFEDYYKYR